MVWTRAVFWVLLVVGFCLGVTSVWWGYSYGFLFLLLPLMFRVFRRPPSPPPVGVRTATTSRPRPAKNSVRATHLP